MGGRRPKLATANQKRLEDMMPLRRSTRTCSQKTLEKEKEKPVQNDNADAHSLEINASQSKNIILSKVDTKIKKGSGKNVTVISSRKKNAAMTHTVQMSQAEQDEILKNFDLNYVYGPCRGISRRDRYLRALKYQLNPAPEHLVLKILEDQKDEPRVQNW